MILVVLTKRTMLRLAVFLQVLRVVRDLFILVHLQECLRIVLMLVVLFKQLRLFYDPYTGCFVQVFRVVLMLVVSFKQLRLLCDSYTCCFVQVCGVVLTLVVLFKQ